MINFSLAAFMLTSLLTRFLLFIASASLLSAILLFSAPALSHPFTEPYNLSTNSLTTSLTQVVENKNTIADPQNCVACHQAAVSSWQQSDHAKAMNIATNKTVLADFNNSITSHYSQKARFFINKKHYFVELTHEKKTKIHQIKYTFGHFPLQQYLVATTNGKYQILPFAWDSRAKTEGGQRWFVIYENEDIKKQDRLHWQQPLQNWNGMCADCHSDGLKRNYNLENNSFDTTFDNINVGCQSCHGKMNEHTKSTATQPKSTRTQPNIVNNWLRKIGENTASWQGVKRDNTFMDACFACHSLRSPLTDGINPAAPFLDQFVPNLITPSLYHADGQIKEEVYVYGSFLQSKMYQAGVNCIDCHDSHTMKIKVPDNGLCLQCHSGEKFNQPTHTYHKADSEGSQCVNCHMSSNRYMGVDDRRDHSFKIPRPDLSITHNTPNACTHCHEDKNNIWATKKLEQWHGKPKKMPLTYQHFLNLQTGNPLTLTQHLAIINDAKLSEIIRASALSLLTYKEPNTIPNTLLIKHIETWVKSDKPLIRLALAQTSSLIPIEQHHRVFATLLADPFKAIRVAAANNLVGNVLVINSKVNAKTMTTALDELLAANNTNAWRGEGNLNQSMVHYRLGQTEKTIASLKRAIKVDPYFSASYINLADLYKSLGDIANETNIFQQALKAMPQNAMVHYSYGLYLIRNKQAQNAITAFKQAVKLDPNNAQYIYLYALALDSVGKTKQATMHLRIMISKANNPQQLAQLGLSFSQKLNDAKSYQFFNKILN